MPQGNPFMAADVLHAFNVLIARMNQRLANEGRLLVAVLQRQPAARRKKPLRSGDQMQQVGHAIGPGHQR